MSIEEAESLASKGYYIECHDGNFRRLGCEKERIDYDKANGLYF